jgi:hypothetical protein
VACYISFPVYRLITVVQLCLLHVSLGFLAAHSASAQQTCINNVGSDEAWEVAELLDDPNMQSYFRDV